VAPSRFFWPVYYSRQKGRRKRLINLFKEYKYAASWKKRRLEVQLPNGRKISSYYKLKEQWRTYRSASHSTHRLLRSQAEKGIHVLTEFKVNSHIRFYWKQFLSKALTHRNKCKCSDEVLQRLFCAVHFSALSFSKSWFYRIRARLLTQIDNCQPCEQQMYAQSFVRL
jgi:hypothetical protein